jgi:hypothetical protein
MFALCLGRIEFRELVEISGWCGAKKSVQWGWQSNPSCGSRLVMPGMMPRSLTRVGAARESEIHYAPSGKIESESELVGGEWKNVRL